jgi:hypothetical protein
VTTAHRWEPAQGGDALNAGWAAQLGVEAADFPIADPADATTATWREFSQAVLGFVPAAIDAARWRSFLSRRYANPGALAAAYGLVETPPEWGSIEPPAALPADGPALVDWFQFQSVVIPVERKAHRFTVLLPWPLHIFDSSGNELDHVQLRDLARRVVELQKPAHTVFNVKFFWAAFRIGEARLGDDTLLAYGSRVPEFVQPAILGRDYLGETRLGGLVATDTVRHAPALPAPPPDSANRQEAP